MKFRLFSCIALNRDVPQYHLKKGDVARIVEYMDDPYHGYALEVFDALGDTIDVVSVSETYLEDVHHGERLQVRHVEA